MNFGNFVGATFSGEIYNDLAGTGVQQPNDPLLSGWTVDLVNSAGMTVATATSNSSGVYTLADVGPGTFTVEEVTPAGWLITQPTNPPGTYTVTSQEGGSVTGLTFGNFHLVTISGTVYNDLNGNGTQNSGEPGLAGWTVELLNSQGGVVESATTGSNGAYALTDVGPGTYSVGQVVQANWVQTQPSYPVDYSVTTKSGTNPSALIFGDYADQGLNPTDVIDNSNGSPEYVETGTWSTGTGGYLGTNRTASTTNGRVPTATASWNFTGLANGTYDVFITYVGKSTYSTTAPYTVYNGGTAFPPVKINQSILVTQSQGGLTQGSYGGVGWLELGSYVINTGTLKVELTNLTSSGRFVDADAALIILDSPSARPAITNPTMAIGVVPETTTTPSPTKSTATKAPTISISGVSTASAIRVLYNQGLQSTGTQSPASLVDEVLGIIDGSAKELISGKKKSS